MTPIITIPFAPSPPFCEGTQVRLTANPDSCWYFNGWSGNLSGFANPQTITMDSNKNVTAKFMNSYNCNTYELTTNVQGSGSIGLNPSGGSYNEGTQVTLTANPVSGWSFSSWSGGLSGSTNPATVTMAANMNITAVFQQNGGGGQVTRIEAENMNLSNYTTENQGSAWSGNSGIKLTASTGTAQTNPPAGGAYDVVVVYQDESDGPATIEIRVDGTLVDSWNLNLNTGQLTSRTVVTNRSFNSNSVFEIKGIKNAGEYCRVDYVEFTASGGGGGGVGGNNAPSVSITSPGTGAIFTAGANITINANASDSDGIVTQVEFFADSNSLGVDSSSPYSVTWTNVPAGSYSLTAKATDDSSATTTSSVMNITVNNGGGGGGTTRVEAEAMTLANYIIEGQGSSWSGNTGIKLLSSSGTAQTNPPAAGAYDVVVVYQDEPDGPATIEIRIDGALVDSWALNQNTGQLMSRTVVTNYNLSR